MAKYLTAMLVLIVVLLSIALIVRGGEMITAMSVSTLHESNFSVSSGNVTPTMSTPNCYQTTGTVQSLGSVALIGNNTVGILCNTTVSDSNGCADFNGTVSGNSLTGKVYEDSVGIGCSESYLDCYANLTCKAVGSCTGGGGTQQVVECTYAMQWNADNTSSNGWDGFMQIVDSGGLQVNDSDSTVDVAPLLSIHVDDTLDFGSVAANTNQSYSATNHSTWNYGNVQIDLQLNGTALDCPSSYTDIPVGFLHYNCTDYNQSYATLSAILTGTADGTSCTGFNLAKSADTTTGPVAPPKKTYWGIGVISGAGGTCNGTVHFTAVSG